MSQAALLERPDTASFAASDVPQANGLYDIIALAGAVLTAGRNWEDFYHAFLKLSATERQNLRSCLWPAPPKNIDDPYPVHLPVLWI